MSTIKTTRNDASVTDFIATVADDTRRQDSQTLLKLYTRVTGEVAKMWGPSIIGFGSYHYKSDRSSQEGDWMLTGFSPRKANLSLYLIDGFDNYPELLGKLGKYKTSKSCLYINKLADIDMNVLEELVLRSFTAMKKQDTAAKK